MGKGKGRAGGAAPGELYGRLTIACIAVGCLVRLLLIGQLPGGINQDEAFAGYEAYSLLRSGTDSFGYSFPVYLTAWGSGMNALNSYLMIPFMAIFGAKTWVVRLPQALVGCASLWVFALLLRRVFGERTAFWGTLFFSVCPWHIMMCRWGLESNLAPGFLLFGMYFFLRGTENTRFFPLSALFYGLSLYCYATIWPIVPLVLLLQAFYSRWTGKLVLDRYCLGAALLLALLALPLVLFLMVNKDLIPEIRTPFLSVPRLLVMRDSEISLAPAAIWENWKNALSILLRQNDGLPWNCTEGYGLYYKGTLVLFLIGLAFCGKRAWESMRTRTFDPVVFGLLQLLGGAVLGGLIHVNVNRINIIHIPILLCVGVGLSKLVELLSGELPRARFWAAGLILAAFCSFGHYYVTDYAGEIGRHFQTGLAEALDRAEELARGREVVLSDISYPKVLFYTQTPVSEYQDSVVYRNYPSAFLDVAAFGHYRFESGQIAPGRIYLMPRDAAAGYQDAGGYAVETYGEIGLVYLP